MKDAGEPMRSVIGRAVGRWDDSRELAFVAPAACVIHEAVFLTRYISFLPLEYDAASVWLLVGCVAAILTCVFLRRRFPLAAMLAACACAAVSSPVDEGAYTGVPLLVLMYGLVARRDHLKAAASVLAVIAAFWVPVHLAGDENLALVHLEWILAVVVAALVSRALWTRRRADQELEDERTAREQIARERDEAEARSRIAGELHDSVGHDLTAIIALSEGLMGATGDETLDAAVASINDLARAGLSATPDVRSGSSRPFTGMPRMRVAPASIRGTTSGPCSSTRVPLALRSRSRRPVPGRQTARRPSWPSL